MIIIMNKKTYITPSMVIIETERQDLLFKASNILFRTEDALDIEDEESNKSWYNGGDAL